MDEYYSPLYNEIIKYIHKEETLSKIEDAYKFMVNAHGDQKRASGEPYLIHPVAVATTLTQYKADPTTIIAALLHDVIEDTKYTYNDIKERYGIEVANLVEGLTKIQKIQYNEAESSNFLGENEYTSNFQKMLFSMSKDIRVIWIKLSDRLNNMQTLKYLPIEKQVRISKETLDIYTPIAHKLGMYHIKAELEDLALKYLYPMEYKELSEKIKDTKKVRDQEVERILKELRELLDKENVKCDISGRAKNLYSIYNKMKNKGLAFENIYDLQAFRIIVDTVMDCYKVLGIVHSKYTPVPQRFKDYIAMPKPNMYQSLHTTVINDGRIFEIQIRTHEMDEIAENGIAAHWAYKEGVKLKANYYESTASKLRWYNDLLKYTSEDAKDQKDEVTNMFNEDVLEANVYVFTPKNTVISLPEGSTPLDFAYRIHSRIGDTYTGAIVNGKIVPIDYVFKTGDVCEIKTSPNAFGPNENWLKIAKTSSARGKIKQFLNNKNRDLTIEQGKENLYLEMKSRKVNLDITDELIAKSIPKERQINTVEDLYYACGKETYSAQAIVNDFVREEEITTNDRILELINKRNRNTVYHEDVSIIVEGLSIPSVKLSKCCSPVPGDDIIGFVTKGVGIAVHRTNCKNCKSLDPNRLIPVYWNAGPDKRFNVNLKILVNNRDSILADILNTAILYNAKIYSAQAVPSNISNAYIYLTVSVVNKTELDIMTANLAKIKGIYSIERQNK